MSTVQLHPTMVAAMLADLADREGVTPAYTAGNAELLASVGLAPETVTPGVVASANRLFRKALDITLARAKPAQVQQTSKEQPDSSGQTVIEPKETRKVCRAMLFGHSITAVIRRLGKEGWEYDDVYFLCGQTEVGAKELAPTTIRIQLAAGKKGERGEPAPLTSEQLAWCRKVCE